MRRPALPLRSTGERGVAFPGYGASGLETSDLKQCLLKSRLAESRPVNGVEIVRGHPQDTVELILCLLVPAFRRQRPSQRNDQVRIVLTEVHRAAHLLLRFIEIHPPVKAATEHSVPIRKSLGTPRNPLETLSGQDVILMPKRLM